MRLFAEEDVVNTFLNKAQQQFELKKYQITVVPGESLLQHPQKKQYQQALQDSLQQLHQQYHQQTNQQNYNQIQPDRFYILVYESTKDQNILHLIFPYGSNLAPILLGALVKRSKAQPKDQAHQLRQLIQETINDLVLHEIFKYYQPAKGSNQQFSKQITDSIRYQTLQKDSFNLVIRFTLPLQETTQKLKQAIQNDLAKNHHQLSNTDYNQLAISNLLSLKYDPDSKNITFITSLY